MKCTHQLQMVATGVGHLGFLLIALKNQYSIRILVLAVRR
jgi:hypothetical protein